MATPADQPAPLRLPAILANPTSSAARQVAAHNAQQREALLARRERHARGSSSADGKLLGKGRRVIRRYDNATFAGNPHIAHPRRSDLAPSVPLHPRPLRPAFPPSALDRSAPIPGAVKVREDPFSGPSVAGGFSTSLRGVRALLRKRGRRAEGVVLRVEACLRGWLAGQEASGGEGWKVVDETLVDLAQVAERPTPADRGGEAGEEETTTGIGGVPIGRRLPPQLRPPTPLPALPIEHGCIPAVLELSRSPAHLTLIATDPFDRLILHLLARYYECLSWSEAYPSPSAPTHTLRLTHIILPHLLRPRAPTRAQLPTPETTDVSDLSELSAPSASESEGEGGRSSATDEGSSSDSDVTVGGGGEDGGALTGPEDGVEGYWVDDSDGANSSDGEEGDRTFRAENAETAAALVRVTLHEDREESAMRRSGSSDSLDSLRSAESVDSVGSSHYAGSEASGFTAASEDSLGSGMADSFSLPLPRLQVPVGGVASAGDAWQSTSLARDSRSVPLPPRRDARTVQERGGWEDRPTFFEYLYGEG